MTVPKKLDIAGVAVSPAHIHELHEGISHLVKTGGQAIVLSGNIHGLNFAYKFPWLKIRGDATALEP